MSRFWTEVAAAVVAILIATILIAYWPAARMLAVRDVIVPLWVFLVIALLFFLVIWLPSRLRRRGTSTPTVNSGGNRVTEAAVARAKFEPNEIQEELIGALRFFDEEYKPPEILYEVLENKFPISDIKQALRQMKAVGWVKDLIGPGHIRYQLHDPALDYARTKGYQVMSAEMRRKLANDRTYRR